MKALRDALVLAWAVGAVVLALLALAGCSSPTDSGEHWTDPWADIRAATTPPKKGTEP